MTATSSASPASAKPVPPLLYPALLIAGICVIIASLLGIAAMSGWLPLAQPQSRAVAEKAVAGGDAAMPETAPALQSGGDSATRMSVQRQQAGRAGGNDMEKK